MSLEKSVRTCDVNVGEANRIQSDRFLNPNNMVCIPWNGLNNKGQEVCPDSFYTKTPGCDSAEDRVSVENSLRPSYMSYVTLGAQGIDGSIYGNPAAQQDSRQRQAFLNSRNNITGNFGLQMGANVGQTSGSCTIGAYEKAMAQESQAARGQSYTRNMARAFKNGRRSGRY